MTNESLISRYRNLLIALSRMQSTMSAESQAIRSAAAFEEQAGRRAGLYCKANALSKQAASLKMTIHRNKAALNHFFKTSSIDAVAEEEIENKN